jgi:hypothetical protein
VPAWVWLIVALPVLAVIGIVAITFLGESSEQQFVPVSNEITDDGYGDDAYLDDLWDECAAGDGAACDSLYYQSPFGSEYEDFGDTCGRRYSQADAPFSCEEAIGG